MNIALDMRQRAGFGVATYVRNIVRALARRDAPGAGGPGHRYILIGGHEQLRDYRGLPENFHLQAFSRSASSLRSAYSFRELLIYHRTDLLHVPHLFKTPRMAPCPHVVTVHDLVDFLYHDSKRPSAWKSRMRFLLARHNLRSARRIVAVSNSTKADLMRVFGLHDDAKIEVCYNAIDAKFLGGHASETERARVSGKYQVDAPFLLYAGSAKPHKNVVRLIEAFSALKGELKKGGEYPDLKLLIIGEDISSNPDLRRTVIRSGVQAEVRFLGFVPIDELRVFYDTAKVFVFPSLYEGFGLPPLEAMAHSTPVVTSNTSSLPEVVGNAAVLVNPENVFEIMHALHRVLVDQELRDVLKERGLKQAAGYSWDATAGKLLEVYAAALAGR
ncbi:MAG: glycosyltransferase family 4 protein [Acidobacteriales bacterium]|nr:glycosyltransferase family 4 protein [Terriglobales bacterium]